jgi:putative ABC transport system ATP-binding protein
VTTHHPVLQVKDLVFAYGSGDRPVLDIPEFAIQRGEHVFLHGPSGSGKTTLLGILAGILKAERGSVRILDHDLSSLSAHERDQIRGADLGYIFQMFNLIPYLSVLDNILLPIRLSKARRERMDRDPALVAQELATHLKIDHLLQKSVTSLSMGQQQRVAAARALIGSPALIIADEPTSALDADHREAFLRLLFAEAELFGSTVLFVSHDHSLKPLFRRVVSLLAINQASSPHLDN